MISNNYKIILKEIEKVFENSDFSLMNDFKKLLKESSNIVLAGAGRVGYMTKAFSMRLKHLGFESFFLGDSNVPGIYQNDLLIIASGSGETQTIYDIAVKAKSKNVKIVLITSNKDSRIGKLSDVIILLKAPSKNIDDNFFSIQPMTTLNEQSLGIFFDSFVLDLMEELNETSQSMWERHSILE